jgi:hypothetical protein
MEASTRDKFMHCYLMFLLSIGYHVPQLQKRSGLTKMALRHREVISWRILPLLQRTMLVDSTDLGHILIELGLPHCPRNSTWHLLEPPSTPWMYCHTKPTVSSHRSRCIGFNLFSGELYVDWKPMTSIPEEYLCHETFEQLFGSMRDYFVPSTHTDMAYKSVHATKGGHKIHLAMQGQILRVRIGNRNLIPKRPLRLELPDEFCDIHTFWHDTATGDIEMCPRIDPLSLIPTIGVFPDPTSRGPFNARGNQCFV